MLPVLYPISQLKLQFEVQTKSPASHSKKSGSATFGPCQIKPRLHQLTLCLQMGQGAAFDGVSTSQGSKRFHFPGSWGHGINSSFGSQSETLPLIYKWEPGFKSPSRLSHVLIPLSALPLSKWTANTHWRELWTLGKAEQHLLEKLCGKKPLQPTFEPIQYMSLQHRPQGSAALLRWNFLL